MYGHSSGRIIVIFLDVFESQFLNAVTVRTAQDEEQEMKAIVLNSKVIY